MKQEDLTIFEDNNSLKEKIELLKKTKKLKEDIIKLLKECETK